MFYTIILNDARVATRPEWSSFCEEDPSTRSEQANKKAGMEGGNVRHKKNKNTHSTKSNRLRNKNAEHF